MRAAPDDITIRLLRDEETLDLSALWRGARVGYAWCMITDGTRLELCDLVVDDQALIPYRFANNLLVTIGIPCRTRDFRHRGIGRMLIQRLFAEARAAGIHEIWASVTQEDIDRTPYLLDWYRRLGFTLMEKDQECLDFAAKKVAIRLVSGDQHTERRTTHRPRPQERTAESQPSTGAGSDRPTAVSDVLATHQHTPTLRGIAKELLSIEESALLDRVIVSGNINFDCLVELDETLGWACMSSVSAGNTGNFVPEDRSVFRPLQYCAGYFRMMQRGSDAGLLARPIIHMSSLHIESLVTRIAGTRGLPLGQVMRKAPFRKQVDPAIWEQISRFCRVYNAAKHDIEYEKETHLFSREDAVLAYFICRALGNRLRHLAKLETCFNPPGGIEK